MRRRSRKPCSVPGCDDPSDSRGLCNKHYQRLLRRGSADAPVRPWTRRPARVVVPRGPTPFERLHVAIAAATETECILWRWRDKAGYARVRVPGSRAIRGAARIVCELAHGQPEEPNLVAAHSCGNGHLGCINPFHLRWATPEANAIERLTHAYAAIERGETPRYKVKLRPEDVLAIREDKRLQSVIAKQYGVSAGLISMVQRKAIWKHV